MAQIPKPSVQKKKRIAGWDNQFLRHDSVPIGPTLVTALANYEIQQGIYIYIAYQHRKTASLKSTQCTSLTNLQSGSLAFMFQWSLNERRPWKETPMGLLPGGWSRFGTGPTTMCRHCW